jgi:hypothetical protein
VAFWWHSREEGRVVRILSIVVIQQFGGIDGSICHRNVCRCGNDRAGTEAIKKLHAEDSIKLYAAAVVARDLSGKLSIKEIAEEGHGITAASVLIGGLAG